MFKFNALFNTQKLCFIYIFNKNAINTIYNLPSSTSNDSMVIT